MPSNSHVSRITYSLHREHPVVDLLCSLLASERSEDQVRSGVSNNCRKLDPRPRSDSDPRLANGHASPPARGHDDQHHPRWAGICSHLPSYEVIKLRTDVVGVLADPLALRILLELVELVGRAVPDQKRRVPLLLQRAREVGGNAPTHLAETNNRGLSLQLSVHW